MIGIHAGIGQGRGVGWISVVLRRAICTIAEGCRVIICLKGHAIVTVVAAMRCGDAIMDDVGWSVCGEGGGERGQVIGIERLPCLARLPECSPELLAFAQLVLETCVILLEVAGFLAGLAAGVLELKDDGLERGD